MLVALALFITLSGHVQAEPDLTGMWRNAGDSVHVEVAPCDEALCGTVTWANDKAVADVAKRGRTLIGTQLFHNFRRGRDGRWRGKVHVPDIGKTFSGTITLDGSATLVARGCLLRNVGCRSQRWTRIAD